MFVKTSNDAVTSMHICVWRVLASIYLDTCTGL